mgnify:CR=1 FL=1|tara:strand:+ start:49425 stop:53801 length:4377 start_codon:yes stop_codon:yes gene_type:complete
MMALTFSQFADIGALLAWQLTLTLMHVLWIGTVIAALAVSCDRILARGASDTASSSFGSANARARYWLNMTALVTLAATLPITFLVVRDSAQQTGASVSNVISETDPVGSSRLVPDATLSEAANTETLKTENKPASRSAQELLTVVAQPDGNSASPLTTFLNQLRNVAPMIAIVYVGGVLMMLVRLAAALCGGQRLTSFGLPVADPSMLDVVATQAMRLTLKAAPMVATCERVAVPVVVGVLKPVILIPTAMLTGLSSQELAAVLAHELAHVKRFDHVLIVVQRFLEAVLFFHPAVWWLGRRIHDLREEACDDLVIQGGTDRMDYARSLLRVAEMRVGDDYRARQIARLAVDGGDPSKLRQRIQRIVQSNDEPGVRLNQSRATFALVASAMAIALSLVPVLPGISDRQLNAASNPAMVEEASVDQGSQAEDAKEEQSNVKRKLQEPAELHVENMPLIAVLDAVEKLSGVPVTVNLDDFLMRGVDPQMPITLDVEDITVRALIDQIVQQAHLTFEIQPGGVLIPANTPAFELRVVPGLPDSNAKVHVPEDWSKSHYRDGTVQGMGSANDAGFAWFPIQKKEHGTVDIPVSGMNGNFQTGLLSDAPDHVLTADGSWHVLEVEVQDDDFGQRNIRVKLDQLGGLHLQRLSKASMNQQLAIIVNGVVISAPIVRSEISREFVITGSFSNDELTMIADAIRGAMVPPVSVLTYDCDVSDETTGEPIVGAEVLWRVRRIPFKRDELPMFEQRFTTDAKGRYTVALPRAVFEFAQMTTEFEVQHSDFLPKKDVGTRLTLPDAPKPAWSDLRHLKLLPGVPVTGRFVNPDGTPAANLPIMVSRSRDAPGAGFRGDVIGRTDAEGRYRLATTSSWPKRLHWFPENFVSDSVALKKATDNPEPITFGDQGTIRLKNGPRLTGSVVDQDGKGLAGIFVQAFTGTTVPVLYAETNADGKFAFTPSPPGEYRVSTTDSFIDPLTETFRGRTLTRPFIGATVNLPKSGEAKPAIIRQAQSDVVTVTAYAEDGSPVLNRQFWTGSEPYRGVTSEPVEEDPGRYRLWVRRGRAATITTNCPQEIATVWQRTVGSAPAPGTGLSLSDVNRNGDEVVVRFRQSGTIRLVVKAGERIIPWDARSLTVKYARAAEFEKLGVRDPGFVISIPKQGPEHVIQRVAPDEDVIIDVGIKGALRKQQTVRVGAGESTTVTIDLAAAPDKEENAAATNKPPTALLKPADFEQAEARYAGLTVKYDIQDSDKEARIRIQNTSVQDSDIGSWQQGMMRYTPLKVGEFLQLNKLIPGDYQVFRYREVEIITLVGGENDPKGPRVNSGVYLDRQLFTLKAGDKKQIIFARAKGQRIKGLVTNMAEFKPNRTIIEICSPNAKDTDRGRGLDVTVFDAHQCNDGKFETDALEPGRYVAIVSGYDAWTEGQMFSSGLPRPHFIGSVEFAVLAESEAEPIELKLRDAFAKVE